MTYDVNKAVEVQDNYIKRTGSPHFAPYDGICWKCNKNIYKEIKHTNEYTNEEYSKGITVEKASSTLVTGCPHCNISYCE